MKHLARMVPLIAVVALIGCGGDGGPFSATPTEIEALVTDEIDGDPSPQAECFQRFCSVSYEIETLVGIDPERELLLKLTPVYAELFSDEQLAKARIILRGTLVSVGGKESVGEILVTSCNRRAARQIDWDAVEPEGFMQLCDWSPQIEIG